MTSVPATLGVYDHDWYKRNSREDPEDTADIDPTVTPIDTGGQNGSSDTTIDEKTKTAKRGKDLSTAYIASQRHGGIHAPLMNANLGRPPPKLEHSGDWKFIEFIPEWTDPLWYDSKLEVEASDPHHRIIRPHNLLRHLRPAQLPMDRIHNPTAMALRYGIFPGRTDGRSRMTPTRSTFRRFAVEGVPRDDIHGLYIAQQAKALAVRSGVGDVDDLLKKYSAMDSNARSRISARDEFVLQAMQDMQDDEDWQSTFFFGITTNDLINDGILSLDNIFEVNLQNDIHRYLRREKWTTTLWRGDSDGFPRLVYQTGERKGEWSPGTDDFLWKRLEPALKLASRILTFLEESDPFWNRLLDVFNRVRIGNDRDDRPKHQKVTYPVHSFSMQLDPPGTPVVPEHMNTVIDPVETTAKILDELELQICSAYHEKGESTAPTAGLTYWDQDRITVNISADSVWPLLVDGYSKDERLMTCFTIASTLIHELAHAVNYAHYHWLVRPGPAALSELEDFPTVQARLEDIGTKIFGNTDEGMEPYFEQEQRAELGFCIEGHLFGGANWSLLGGHTVLAKHLFFLPSGIVMRRWPTGLQSDRPSSDATEKAPSSLVLKKPPLVAATYSTCIKVARIARFFTEEFWQTEVPRYGNAAMRLGSDLPARVILPTDETFLQGAFNSIPDEDALIFKDWPENLHKTNPLVGEFLEMLAQEFLRLAVAKFKWHRDVCSWPTRRRLLQQSGLQIMVVFLEARTACCYEKLCQLNPATAMEALKADLLTKYRENITRIEGKHGQHDFQLPEGSEALVEDEDFWENLPAAAQTAPRRLRALFRTMYDELLYEVRCIQALYLDIFKLNDLDKTIFAEQPVIKTLNARVRKIIDLHDIPLAVLEWMYQMDFATDVPTEFGNKYLSLKQMASELLRWAGDIRQISNHNWTQLLPLVPNINKSKRTASMRLVKFARKEIELMPVADLERIQDFVKCMQSLSVPAAKLINIETKRNFDRFIEDVGDKFRGVYGDVPDDVESNAQDGDPLSHFLLCNRIEMAKNTDQDRKRVRYTVPPSLHHPTLIHPSTMTALTPAKALSLNYSPPQYGAASKHKPRSGFHRLDRDVDNVFARLPSVTFPPARRDESAFASNLPSDLPAVSPMKEVQETGPATPASIGIFPAPYGLTASFTDDLQHEARFTEEAARYHPQPPPVSRSRPRDELFTILESPESRGGFLSRFWDPNEGTPPRETGIVRNFPPATKASPSEKTASSANQGTFDGKLPLAFGSGVAQKSAKGHMPSGCFVGTEGFLTDDMDLDAEDVEWSAKSTQARMQRDDMQMEVD